MSDSLCTDQGESWRGTSDRWRHTTLLGVHFVIKVPVMCYLDLTDFVLRPVTKEISSWNLLCISNEVWSSSTTVSSVALFVQGVCLNNKPYTDNSDTTDRTYGATVLCQFYLIIRRGCRITSTKLRGVSLVWLLWKLKYKKPKIFFFTLKKTTTSV